MEKSAVCAARSASSTAGWADDPIQGGQELVLLLDLGDKVLVHGQGDYVGPELLRCLTGFTPAGCSASPEPCRP
jgi:hypothetical protein